MQIFLWVVVYTCFVSLVLSLHENSVEDSRDWSKLLSWSLAFTQAWHPMLKVMEWTWCSFQDPYFSDERVLDEEMCSDNRVSLNENDWNLRLVWLVWARFEACSGAQLNHCTGRATSPVDKQSRTRYLMESGVHHSKASTAGVARALHSE